MRDDLLFHYERELTYLRYLSADFAKRYPKIAGRLLLEDSGKSEDPHVARLMESFAFIAARIHTKLDDEFPQIIESLFTIIYPHYLRPRPSAAITQFHLDRENGKLVNGFSIPRNSLLESAPVSGVPCKFKTCFDTTLWPIDIKAADWRSVDRVQPAVPGAGGSAVVRLEMQGFEDLTFSAMKLKNLRLFMQGEGSMVHSLVEVLCNNCTQIVIRDLASPQKRYLTLPASSLRQIGFAENEALLPFPRRSFWGYRLIDEYFSFPEKFCFIELSGLERLADANLGNRVELLFYLSDFERADRRQAFELGVSKNTFRLGCTPVLNLFEQTAEPILVEQKKFEYRIVVDARREQAFDIFSVDEVVGITAGNIEPLLYEPFYAHRHTRNRDGGRAFWHIDRRASVSRGGAYDVYIHFVDLTGNKVTPDRDTVTVRLSCSNGELPSRLPFGHEAGDFQLEGASVVKRIIALTKPTDTLQPPAGQGLLWRLLSHFSLNYLSLISEGLDAFKETLRLHNFGESNAADKQIDGITSLRSTPHFARLTSQHGISFARGTRVELEFDEDLFAGTGVYTFAAVLDVFLGLYASMNSFTQLSVRTRQRKRILKQWPPRSGQKILV